MREESPHGATTIRASKHSGGGSKWLLGALAAVILAGGGYYAWKNFGPLPPSAQTANIEPYEPYAEEPPRAAPLESGETESGDAVATNESAAGPAASNAAPATPAQTAAVAEETIGVTPVSDTTTDSDPIIVTAPRHSVWVRMPSARRLAALYPERALERGREGEARLHCIVQSGGALDCEKVDETPGFGNAALRVARTLRHAQTLADGSDAIGSPVNLHVVFRMSDEDRRRG